MTCRIPVRTGSRSNRRWADLDLTRPVVSDTSAPIRQELTLGSSVLRLADQSATTVTKAISDLASASDLENLARAVTVIQRGLLRIWHPDQYRRSDEPSLHNRALSTGNRAVPVLGASPRVVANDHLPDDAEIIACQTSLRIDEREVLPDLFEVRARFHQVHQVLDRDPVPANTRPPAHLSRLDCHTIKDTHDRQPDPNPPSSPQATRRPDRDSNAGGTRSCGTNNADRELATPGPAALDDLGLFACSPVRLFHAAARLIRGGRRTRLMIAATWPWADAIVTA
jgi:hypothetical protein